jgi:hypothetical protein
VRNRLAVSAAVAIYVAASPALAECSVSSDAGAVAKPIDMTVQADANIVASMSLLPKLMHIDYSSASGKKPSCDLGQFTAGAASYELYGDDKAGRQRTAKPARKGDPIAQIVPVTDIMKAIGASKQGKSATVEGYLLATVTRTEFTGWRYYTGMPDTATLKRTWLRPWAAAPLRFSEMGLTAKRRYSYPSGNSLRGSGSSNPWSQVT